MSEIKLHDLSNVIPFTSGHDYRGITVRLFNNGDFQSIFQKTAIFIRDLGMPDSEIFQAIMNEYNKANEKFGPFKSYYEGIGVLEEEMDELWEVIKSCRSVWKAESPYYRKRMMEEAIQVAAMAYKITLGYQEK